LHNFHSTDLCAAPRAATEEVGLDLGRYELRRFGRRVKLEKKSMEFEVLVNWLQAKYPDQLGLL
jgi:hypothetical protein